MYLLQSDLSNECFYFFISFFLFFFICCYQASISCTVKKTHKIKKIAFVKFLIDNFLHSTREVLLLIFQKVSYDFNFFWDFLFFHIGFFLPQEILINTLNFPTLHQCLSLRNSRIDICFLLFKC